MGCRKHVPVWHEGTRKWVREGRLALLGVTQEQHADRCRLFAQWHCLDWPILHDPIDVLGLNGVPVLVALDEHGIIRAVNPPLETFERDFIGRSFPEDAPESRPLLRRPPRRAELARQAQAAGTAEAWRNLGDALVLWEGSRRLDEAIDAYAQALRADPRDAASLFRLGVCHRMRSETRQAQVGDFQRAVDYWGQALAIDPNVYIWRRRIQQYGPRLDKPYAFYDWVSEAMRAVTARGEQPVRLAVRPGGAEIAHPAKEVAAPAEPAGEPDTGGRIARDEECLVDIEAAVVPSRIAPGQGARVHLILAPDTRKACWNNEAEPLRVWVSAPAGWRVSDRLLLAPTGTGAESSETRRVDFEVQAPTDARGPTALRAYALYYVCEKKSGACRFLRQDFDISVRVGE